ncbi:hypothetical protein HDU97_003979 [Phlyctochytrium planicorne]|nr:hypothetical protein HDU97_003979 [Phlyctochytrium planicorne]
MLNPVFRLKNISAMVPIFGTYAASFRDSWIELIESTASADGSKVVELDIYEELSKVTLDIIGKAGFNYEFKATENKSSPLFSAFQVLMSYATLSLAGITENFIPAVRKLPIERNVRRNNGQKTVRDIVDGIIANRGKIEKVARSNVDLLSILLSENETSSKQDALSPDEIAGQVLTFVAAGHETTSVSLSWALHLLSQNMEIQDKLREEILGELPNAKDIPTWESLSKLPYLESVMRETLRLVPPAPITTRIAATDDYIDGYLIPRGTAIIICPGVTHRLEEYWGEDAEVFRPERWGTDEEGESSRPFGAYMPFLLGPRNCIGMKFATTEFKLILAVLIQNFRFEPVEGLVVRKKLTITWKPFPVLKLRVSRIVE